MALQVDIYRVDHRDGFSMPRIALANRRAAGAPQLQWICQRHLEILLFNRTDGGSSGAIWKALSQSGLGSTSLCCSKKAVSDGVLLAAEFAQIMAVFKQALPADVCDPSSLGRSARSASAPTHSLALVRATPMIASLLSCAPLRAALCQSAFAPSFPSLPPPWSAGSTVARARQSRGCAPLARCSSALSNPRLHVWPRG